MVVSAELTRDASGLCKVNAVCARWLGDRREPRHRKQVRLEGTRRFEQWVSATRHWTAVACC
jgi:hypothetical protein